MIKNLKDSILKLLENQPNHVLDLKRLYKATMEPLKREIPSKSERKDMFGDLLVSLQNAGIVSVDENQIVHLEHFEVSGNKRKSGDLDELVSSNNSIDVSVDNIGGSIADFLGKQPEHSMNRKSLRKVVMKPSLLDKADRRSTFKETLTQLQSDLVVEFDGDVVKLIEKPSNQITNERSHKMQKTSHISHLATSQTAPETVSAAQFLQQTSMSDVILNILSKRYNNTWISKAELRQYTFEQHTSNTSQSTESNRKAEFKATLKALCKQGRAEKSEDGVRLVIPISDDRSEVTIKNEPGLDGAMEEGDVEGGGLKTGKWSEEEIVQLRELVPLHQKMHMGQMRPSWKTIGTLLRRDSDECFDKYRTITRVIDVSLTTGHYTPEEDEVIREHVEIFNGDEKSVDLWMVLAAELNRDKHTIKERWLSTLRNDIGKKRTLFWTQEMDDQLIAAHEIFGPNWTRIAKILGADDASRVGDRWRKHLCPDQKTRNTAPWTEEEIATLNALVPKYTCQKGRSVVVNWINLSRELNRKHLDCANKWSCIQRVDMKHGPFSEIECALITKRVQEWNNKGVGLWVSLEREMGRPSSSVQGKWDRDLRHRVL